MCEESCTSFNAAREELRVRLSSFQYLRDGSTFLTFRALFLFGSPEQIFTRYVFQFSAPAGHLLDVVGLLIILPVLIQLVDFAGHVPLLFQIKSLQANNNVCWQQGVFFERREDLRNLYCSSQISRI